MMTSNDIQTLVDIWHNGNRKDVIAAIVAAAPADAARIALRLAASFECDPYDTGILSRMLANAAE